MELEKVVKERDELKVKIEKWEESSKSLDKLLNSQMSANEKNGLGYGIQLDEMSYKSETDSEISMSVFEIRSSDEEITPANDRFSKADGYHAVPPPITGNFLTPRADISFAGLDEFAIRKKIIESKTTELKSDTSKSKTSETVGNTNEVNVEKPKSVYESVVPKPKINRDRVIIEDWNSDDENDMSDVVSQKSGIGFKKVKSCFVCKSTDHLIKDYNIYDKKSPEPKLRNVVNTGQKVVKPVWDNAKRVNHQKNSNKLKYPQARRTFVPSGVLTRTGVVSTVRPKVNHVRPNASTVRPKVNPVRPNISTARSVGTIRPIYPRMDNVRPRASYSPIKRSYYTKLAFRPKVLKKDIKTFGVKNMTTIGTRAVANTGKGKMENALKKSRWVWRPKGNYMDHESKESGSFILKKIEYADPKRDFQDHAVVNSGFSSHMTCNKAYLSDYEDYNGGFVAFGSDLKGGKITGKGKIRTANLDFDDVYFVDGLKFNLFSVLQMCDKKNSVLFIDTECIILSPGFKLLDENQVVLRVARQNDVYSLDLNNIVPSGGLENQLNHKVKIIRCDHGTEFKNYSMNELCAKKRIKREFSIARTPQQNEAVNTACYVLNRVLVIKPQNKTPYELLLGKSPSISFMRPFGCPLTILNTLDPLGKFDGKSDEGYLLGYSTTSKAFRVYNKRTKRVEENLHIDFLEHQPNVAGSGPDWMFDLDFLTNTMNYVPFSVENQVYVDAGTQEYSVASLSRKDKESTQEYIIHHHRPRILVEDVVQAAQDKPSENAPKDKDIQDLEDVADNEEQHKLKEAEQALKDDLEKMRAAQATSINKLNTGRPSVSTFNSPLVSTANTPYASVASTPLGADDGGSSFIYLGGQIPIDASTLPNADLPMADLNNMDNTINVSPIATLRVHKHHPKDQILGDPKSAVQTRGKIQKVSSVQQALFELQKVWILVDLPSGKKAIGTKWVFRNKRDERGIVVKNKAKLVAQGHRQEEGIDYHEVFAPIARIEAIRLFLAFALFMRFPVYQMDVKSAFLYGTIGEEVYIHQPPSFVDPTHPNKVYKVVKALYGLHQAPRAWYETLSTFLLENGYMRGTIDKTLFIKKHKSDIMLVQVKQQPDGIFISQEKYVADILKKFDFCSIRTATTPFESNKPLVKDKDGVDVDVHIYRSMIGSLMYLIASRPDIMFAVCACARFQVTPKASHLHAVKMIFWYLKHQPKLGLWYLRDSPFELEAFSDSDYGGASLDKKSTTGGCQFLGRRLISWQCKKQTIVANSTTEAEYVAAASCCGQVLWIQNQMMDYGFNFMNTKIHIDNESTICIVKNPIYHSRTKHIEIRHHFIRDCYKKRLIDVLKIHTDNNVADILTKGFDVTRFNFLIVSIGMLNL
ncbi:putative ribonuclease H-like domain-containing protein [Tanacetum coccineum]